MFALIVTLIIVGILLWAVNTYLPIDGAIKKIINIIVIICVIAYVLNAFGLFDHVKDVPVPKIR